jgi:tRNA-dihydrouridine synthase
MNEAPIASPLISLAPLQGVTTRVFRNAYARRFGGVDYAVAPYLMSVPAPDPRGEHFRELFPEYNARMPVVPQILSNDAAGFAATAAALGELGYDEVNWNLGCPYPMVTRKRRGAGLLPYPDAVKAFLDEVCGVMRLKLSIKLRLGLVDPGEVLGLMPVLNDYPLRAVILHPRVGAQMYEGSVDLDAFAEAASMSSRELAYNGDIVDPASYDTVRARFPSVSEFMLGRGVVSDPFLPARIKGLRMPDDPMATIKAFHDDVYFGYREALSGRKHALDKMKELWSYLGASFPRSGGGLKAIRKAASFEAYETALRTVFSDSAQ